IFVKGYLSAYTRLLGLPADECIAEYTAAVDGAAPPPLVIRRGTGDDIDTSSSRRIARLVTWLVLLVAIVMVALWWYALGDDERRAVAVEEPVIAVPAFEPEPEPVVEVEPEPELLPVADPATRVVDEPAPAPIAAAPSLSVRLSYRDASWTEIVDATGTRLYFDLARAGSVVEVSGTPPLSVFHVNSPAVDIVVDGRTFDQTRYNRAGNVARFAVGAGRTTSR